MPTCLITGANRGIGLEFARQYAADGWHVIATCRRPEGAVALAKVAGRVRIEALEVTDAAAVARLPERLGTLPIDLLINNAGIYGPRRVTYNAADGRVWADVLAVNTIAPLKVSAALVEHVAHSTGRTIVAISSLMGSIADNTSGNAYMYRSSKAALNAVMRSLAIDLYPRRIIVTALHPGWVRTALGGVGAPLDAADSVRGLRRVIASLKPEDSGRFFDYEGRELRW